MILDIITVVVMAVEVFSSIMLLANGEPGTHQGVSVISLNAMIEQSQLDPAS